MLGLVILLAWTVASYRIAEASNMPSLIWTLAGFGLPLFFEIAFVSTTGISFLGLALGIIAWLVVFTIAKPAGQ